MTGPQLYQQAPSQGGWQQVPGGYGAQQQLPPGLSAMQQNVQSNLPPQMQMQQNPLLDPPSPLSMVQPNMPQQRQVQQQAPQGQQADPRFYQQPQYQQQVPQGVGAQTRLDGPDVPLHYRGRSVGEVVQMLEGMRQFHFQNQQQQQQVQQRPAPQPGQAQQVNGQPQDPAAQQPGWDWKKPDESIARVVDQRVKQHTDELFNRLQPMLAPVAANTMMQEAQSARQSAANQIGHQRYAQLEPAIMDFLRGADPQSLTNPATWTAAARYVVGDLAMRGVQVPNGQPQSNGHQPGAFPVQQVGQIHNPSPNLNTFFSEQPNQGAVGPQGLQLDQAQLSMAQAMGIAPSDFAAWAGGLAYSNARNGAR